MEIIQGAQLDIIHHLIQRDLIFIVEEIFSFLDFSSLMHCELVSKDWNLAIRNGRSWQKIYDKESKKNPLFHKALLGYEEHEESKHQDEITGSHRSSHSRDCSTPGKKYRKTGL